MLSIIRNVRLSVCPSVCLSVFMDTQATSSQREREIIIGSMAPYAWIEITTPGDRVPVSRHSRRKDINSRECHSNSKVDNRPRRSVCAARFEVQVADVTASLGQYNLPRDRL